MFQWPVNYAFFLGIIGNMGSNHIWKYFWFLHWQKLLLQPLATLLIFFFWSIIMEIWSIYYSLYFGSFKIHKHCLFGRYLVLTYIVRFSSTVFCFFSYIFWSVNCMSWVSKFHNFFLTCSETEARFIVESIKYCPLMES